MHKYHFISRHIHERIASCSSLQELVKRSRKRWRITDIKPITELKG